MNFVSYIIGLVGIRGGTDNTEIGNTSDSLHAKVTSSALPTGASTATNQTTNHTRLGSLTETAPATDTASSGLNGRLQRIAQRLTSVYTALTDGSQQVKIKGDTDNTLIGNVGTAIRVYNVNEGELADQNYADAALENGGSNDMTVDGSTTPVDFDYAPTGSKIVRIEYISLLVQDNGNSSLDSFGAIAGGLTTGIEVSYQSDGVLYPLMTCQDNAELLLHFIDGAGAGSGGGFASQSDFFYGAARFKAPIRLVATEGDYLRIKVNDDLTGLNRMNTIVRVREEIV